MQNHPFQRASALVSWLRDAGTLQPDPLIFLDIGCSGKIPPDVEKLGEGLVYHGVDPWIDDIERLREKYSHMNAQYYCLSIGKKSDIEIIRGCAHSNNESNRPDYALTVDEYYMRHGAGQHVRTSQSFRWWERRLSEQVMSLDSFLGDNAIPEVDFLDVDTDGADLSVLQSGGSVLSDRRTLGLQVEAEAGNRNSFSDIDGLLREHGFFLYDLKKAQKTYGALPAPFRYRHLGQSLGGPVRWFEVIYFRDPLHPDMEQHVRATFSPLKLLRWICLFDIYGLRDCAALVALHYRDMLECSVSVTDALDRLTPNIDGQPTSYESYREAFSAGHPVFFPAKTAFQP